MFECTFCKTNSCVRSVNHLILSHLINDNDINTVLECHQDHNTEQFNSQIFFNSCKVKDYVFRLTFICLYFICMGRLGYFSCGVNVIVTNFCQIMDNGLLEIDFVCLTHVLKYFLVKF